MRIRFADEERTVEVEEGRTIQEAMVSAGLAFDAPCGGKGLCGKCRVRLEGRAEPVLACQTPCRDGMVVYTGARSGSVRILQEFSGARRAGEMFSERDEKQALERTAERQESEAGHREYAAAFDIGTTTIAAYLLDRKRGEILCGAGRPNPQIRHGADVISRIEFAGQGNARLLSQELRDAVNELILILAAQCHIHKEEILTVTAAGNTCMNHLFLEIPTDSLVRIPYEPSLYEAQDLSASEYGIEIHPEGRLLTFPNIAGFVGGDTAACLLAADFEHREQMTLLIDIGTNGELVLGNRKRRLACSTAAGPALEGARISCGMPGADGAIDHVWLEDGKVRFSVIGSGEAKGICGSGLLDAAAALLELGTLDESGAFLTEEKEYRFSDKVSLTQRDIRELQLAKGAIAAGIRILCRRMGIFLKEIESVLVAGAFGNYMNADSACRIGLIPSELRDRIHTIGNAAGEGSCLAACGEAAFALASKLASETEFVELASDADFQEIFVEELEFCE